MNVAQGMRAAIALAAWLLAASASAQEPGRVQQSGARIELDSVAALVAAVAGCAALHSAAAEALEHGGLPAYADVARRRAEADQLTAMYLVAEDRVAKGGVRREVTSYTSYVEQLTAAARQQMAAIVTLQDIARFTKEEDYCASFIALEDETMAKIGAEDPRTGPAAGAASEAVANN
jgi:hypothetical protein